MSDHHRMTPIWNFSMAVGGGMALALALWQFGARLSESVVTWFAPGDAWNLLLLALVLVALNFPATALWRSRPAGPVTGLMTLAYPAVLALAWYVMLFSNDAFGAGLFMMYVVMPLCLLIGFGVLAFCPPLRDTGGAK